MTTLVHQLGPDGHCLLCGILLSPYDDAKPGEFVGVHESAMVHHYRIGDANKDPLCDGRPASAVKQQSRGPKRAQSFTGGTAADD